MPRKYEARDEREAKVEAADHFANARQLVTKAKTAPTARPEPDGALCVAAVELIANERAWPRELPVLLGVPKGRWRRWLLEGAADHEAGRETPAAELATTVARATARLEGGYRAAVEALASNRAGWQAATWLLTHLRPGVYCERTAQAVDAEVQRLLSVAADALTPAEFQRLVRALEAARDQGDGPPAAEGA